jgi:hypothetical protein
MLQSNKLEFGQPLGYRYWILFSIIFGFLVFNLFVMVNLARAEQSEEVATAWQNIGTSYISVSSNQTGIGQTFKTSENQTIITEIGFFGGGDSADGSVYNCYLRQGFGGAVVGYASTTIPEDWLWRICDFGSVAVATGTTYAFDLIRDSGTEAKQIFYDGNLYANGSARVYSAYPASYTAYADRDYTFYIGGTLTFPSTECEECPECDECSNIIPTTTPPALSEGIDGSIFSMIEFYNFIGWIFVIVSLVYGVYHMIIKQGLKE